MKNSIIYYFSELRIENISYVITVDCRLSITELSKPGVPLHGAKFVYESEDVDDFYVDNAFATAGCLMMANNNMSTRSGRCRDLLYFDRGLCGKTWTKATVGKPNEVFA